MFRHVNTSHSHLLFYFEDAILMTCAISPTNFSHLDTEKKRTARSEGDTEIAAHIGLLSVIQ